MRLRVLVAAALLTTSLAAPQVALGHTVSVAMKTGSGGAHYSSHYHASPTSGCGTGAYSVDFYVGWGTVTNTTVYLQTVTIKLIVHSGWAAYRDLQIYDDFGHGWTSGTWWGQTRYGVGSYAFNYSIYKTFRHDNLEAVVLDTYTNSGRVVSLQCAIHDYVLLS